VCLCCPWLVLAPKVFQLCTNHFVWVLCRLMWVSEACQLFLIPSWSSNTPLYPSKCCELRNVPRLFLLLLFFTWIHIWIFQGVGSASNGIRTLANVIITDPTWANLLHWSCVIQGFIASDITQAKEKKYHNWHLTNQFLPLTIEAFGCLHKHTNVFLHNCANAIWRLKRPEALYLSTLVSFVCQKVPINYKRCKHLSSQVRQ